MSTPQSRAKSWGYRVEKATEKAVGAFVWGLRRVGSIGYTKAAADLVKDAPGQPVRMVVTRDKRRPLLVTLSVADLERLVRQSWDDTYYHTPFRIQVKGRARSWIGTLYDELRRAS